MMVDEATSEVLTLHEAFLKLDALRIDIDRRFVALSANSSDQDLLWLELETVLAKQRKIVELMTRSSATCMIELHAKADVLATLSQLKEDLGKHLAASLAADIKLLGSIRA